CLPTSGFPGGENVQPLPTQKAASRFISPARPRSYQQQLTAAAFQLPPNQQGPATGAFIPTSWTGDLFQGSFVSNSHLGLNYHGALETQLKR
uniref:NumbF domain-containing protein n=1 Tax=Macrostomum lignano TaxID=282301 RepID=A0A1I8JL36_9PLAT